MEARGRTAAADALGVNYRTVVANLDAGRLSRRMRTAVQRFERAESEEAEDTRSTGKSEDTSQTAEPRVNVLTEEVRQLCETMQSQAGELEELGRPPRRANGLPDAGVVTLEPQTDEEHAFGPVAGLMAEWRELRTGGARRGSTVDQAKAEERRLVPRSI